MLRLTEAEMTPKDYFFNDQHYCVVLGSEDKRDRVDANGVTWVSAGGGWLPDAKSAALRCYMSLENIPGPLRFADEVSADE